MKPIAIYDVSERVRTWSGHGLVAGSIFGVVLGATLTASLFPNDVLTFGVSGTFIICVAECGFFGAAFGILTAALSRPTVGAKPGRVLPRKTSFYIHVAD